MATSIDELQDKLEEAKDILEHCIEIMTTEQLSRVKGIRAWIETYPEEALCTKHLSCEDYAK